MLSMATQRHPSTLEKLGWLHVPHLPDHLLAVAQPFEKLAKTLIEQVPDHPQLTLCLQHLIDAKDCAVRAKVAEDNGGTGS